MPGRQQVVGQPGAGEARDHHLRDSRSQWIGMPSHMSHSVRARNDSDGLTGRSAHHQHPIGAGAEEAGRIHELRITRYGREPRGNNGKDVVDAHPATRFLLFVTRAWSPDSPASLWQKQPAPLAMVAVRMANLV